MIKGGKNYLGLTAGILGLATLGLIGLIVPARNYSLLTRKSREIGGFSLPDDLPTPVTRHLLAVLGINPPLIQSALMWGRGRIKTRGIWMPIRFRCHYKDNLHYLKQMQLTWFGFPISSNYKLHKSGSASSGMNASDNPYTSDDEKHQNDWITLWAESMWMPSILFSEQVARWEAIDEATAWLIVTNNSSTEPILARFNPHNGLIEEINTLRHRKPGGEKINWQAAYTQWKPFHRLLLPGKIVIAWEDIGTYAWFNLEGVEYNPHIPAT
jgi:hypothetical protein